MDFLQTREYYILLTEKTINRLKSENAVFDARISINALSECEDRQSEDYQNVFSYLLAAMDGETEQLEVGKLSMEQVIYASYLIQAVYDCVTMTV